MDRDIFEYSNGQRQVFGDPLRLWRKFFVACEAQPNEWLAAAQDAENGLRACEYTERVLTAARNVFAMTHFDDVTGKGATDNDVYDVISSFFDWLKKKGTTAGN